MDGTLNQYLQPVNAPVGQPDPFDLAINFDINTDRNIIGNTKLKNFSFSSGTGGTITLGGINNGNGVLRILNSSGTIAAQGDNSGFIVYDANGFQFGLSDNGLGSPVTYASFGAVGTSGNVIFDAEVGIGFQVNASDAIFQMGAFSQGHFDVNAATANFNAKVQVNNDIAASNIVLSQKMHSKDLQTDSATIQIGTAIKTAVVPTSDGYKALYCSEAPSPWFFDFCESKDKIDPTFLEVTEPPYHFIKCEDGEYQVWGMRKGFSNVRFTPKTEEEAMANDNFWNSAQVDSQKVK